MNQLSLFDQRPASPPPTDPHVVADDEQRLTGQNRTILYMLRQRPHTNDELSEIALKYSSRISDLRAAGYTITATRQKGGVFIYTLEE
jgi:hypothetical protein